MIHQGNWSGDRYNAMIAPYEVGPMRFAGALWYQGGVLTLTLTLTLKRHPTPFSLDTLPQLLPLAVDLTRNPKTGLGGESNVGSGRYYAQAFPAMLQACTPPLLARR